MRYNKSITLLYSSVIFVLILCLSCGKKKIDVVTQPVSLDELPSISSKYDTLLVSDSGRVQMKIITETLMIFNKAKEPYTLFTDDVYMEQYDSLMNVKTTLVADSIWNFNRQRLWKLKGDVKVKTTEGKSYESQELFWDEAKQKIYSDEYVIIHQPNESTIKAYGFEANQNLTEYTFKRVEDTDLYLKEEDTGSTE